MARNYSLTDKILHYLALESKASGEILFDIEKCLYSKSSPDPSAGKHVFVSGLARAGTTILMRSIYNSGQCASLTYKDMPFVLCPNAWSNITGRFTRKAIQQERVHGDGIIVDFNSPEALEEIFWRTFTKGDYIKEYGLIPYSPGEDVLSSFVNYVGLILNRNDKQRYLSKNNNNILRLPSIISSFPNAIFLIPVRHPISHCWSLLSQHRRFLNADSFTKKYMRWLGHHEFGATHKPFIFNSKRMRCLDADELSYWAEMWLHCYEYLHRSFSDAKRVYFVPYETLCGDQRFWPRLAELIDISSDHEGFFRQSHTEVGVDTDFEEMKKAGALYSKIQEQALKKLGINP